MSGPNIERQLIPDVESACKGDHNAYERLIKECQKAVSSIALAIVKDLDGSEEVAQDVFIHVWQKLDTLRNPASFLPWVRQVTRYRAFNYLRDNKINKTVRGDEADALLEKLSNHTGPINELLRDEKSQLLASFIDQLPDESREVVLLYYREEQSSVQVANLLGVSDALVRKKLQRARKTLTENMLARFASLLTITSPSLAFTSALTAALAGLSPPAAATASSMMTSSSAGYVLGKPLAILSGALIGALAGLIGVVIGMQTLIRTTSYMPLRRRFVNIRNTSSVAVILFGIALAYAYEYTSSAVAPIAIYLFFVLFLGLQHHRTWKVIKSNPQHIDPKQSRSQVVSIIGLGLGVTTGLLGVIVGMLQSGRL